jgi:hypothetical protein
MEKLQHLFLKARQSKYTEYVFFFSAFLLVDFFINKKVSLLQAFVAVFAYYLTKYAFEAFSKK